MKIVYVILHYNAYEMTKACVESLKKIKSNESEIVLIDNHSSNNSGVLLESDYQADRDVHIIVTNQNLGFAKGNNIGYRYARQMLKADIVVDINNDILIQQPDFEESLQRLAETREVAVVAPKTINRENINQNPLRKKPLSTKALIKSLLYNSAFEFCCHNAVLHKLFKMVHIKRKEVLQQKNEKFVSSKHELYDVIPHGACVIFLTEYIRISENAFPPITFFYGEEDVLFEYLMINGMHTLYTEELTVRHMEKVSTNTVSEKDIQSDLFKCSNMKLSILALLKYRKENNICR